MMTLSESVKILNLFFNKFCPAYINDIIPNNAIFPYLTYSVEIPNFEEEGNIIVRIYNKGSGLIPLFEIADLIKVQRYYQLNQRSLKTHDELLEKICNFSR